MKPQIPGATRWNSQLECIKIFNKSIPFYLMINAQHEDILGPRIISIIYNTGLTSQVDTYRSSVVIYTPYVGNGLSTMFVVLHRMYTGKSAYITHYRNPLYAS